MGQPLSGLRSVSPGFAGSSRRVKTSTYVVILVALLVLNVPWVITGSEKSSVPRLSGLGAL